MENEAFIDDVPIKTSIYQLETSIYKGFTLDINIIFYLSYGIIFIWDNHL